MVAMQPGRKLIVMRHAKAGELPGGPDAERALKTRGRRDAAAAGEWLRKHDYRPDAVICSAARRARQTWQCVAEQLGGQRPVSVDPRLYQAGAAELTGIVAGTPADVGTVMYVGHNPAAVELVAALTGEEVELPRLGGRRDRGLGTVARAGARRRPAGRVLAPPSLARRAG